MSSAHRIDLEGFRSGKLIAQTRSTRRCHWICKCDCGSVIETFYGNLISGKARSCGCGQLEDLREYIESNSIPIPFVGCWMWLGPFFNHGYGQIYVPGIKDRLAHRLSYLAFNEISPADNQHGRDVVMHSCDNQWCVYPNHLSLGTDKENTDDMDRKGRRPLKFSNGDVETIRQMTDRGIANRAIARIMGSSASYISMVKHHLRRPRLNA